MPFVKKTDLQGSQPPTDLRKIFIGREGELLFFRQNILKPEDPTHNIISISGQSGVGKSTLLAWYRDETHAPEFKDYCLTALVDERQATPASIMEKFADQLRIEGEFKKALSQYKQSLWNLQTERETLQDVALHRVPDFAGAAVEGLPFVGPLAREGVKLSAAHLLDKYRTSRIRKDTERLEDPVDDLTRTFVAELNQLATTKVILSSHRVYRERRILLFFDTFEQLAREAGSWLLNHFLEADINDNVVLIIAGRDPIEYSSPNDPKRWLPYHDNGIIYSISLNSFTEDETRSYLAKRGITNPAGIDTIWHLSRGLPLYLSLLTSNVPRKVDPTKDVVDNFLRWIPEQEHVNRRLVLDASLLSKPFNQDDLEAFTYLPENEQPSFYRWLIGQPFVQSSPQDGLYTYHELAQELFSRHFYQRSQKEYYTARRTLADHYKRMLRKIQEEGNEEVYRPSEWLELALAPVYQWFFLPDEASHMKAVEQVLYIYTHANKEQTGEIVRTLNKLSQEQPIQQRNPNAKQHVRQILKFIEADSGSQESIVAASSLLEHLIHKPSFSIDLLKPIYHKRGNAYSRLKEYERAIADFNHMLELDPNDASAYGNRGRAYYWLKEYPRALSDFDHALELDPSDFATLNYRGWAYYCLKEYERAIADFDRTLELDPHHASAYEGRGFTTLLTSTGRLRAILIVLSKLVPISVT